MAPEFSIPPRSFFELHFMQFQGVVGDPGGINNLARIFNESVKLALSSKKLATALDRRDLAMDAYYQLREIMPADDPGWHGQPSTDWHKQAVLVASNLLKLFPAYSVANCALGDVEKAVKLKSQKTRAQRIQGAVASMGEAYGNLSLAYELADEARQHLDGIKAQMDALIAGATEGDLPSGSS